MMQIIYTPTQWSRLSPADLQGAVAVVVDQLRATSTMVTALARGARSILAVEDLSTARRYLQEYPSVLLAGERGGKKPEGFDLGNSPLEFSSEQVKNREIVLTTTNGTKALLACRAAAQVWIASLLNLEAVINRLRRLPPAQTLFLVVAGTGPDFALEDGLVLAEIAAALYPHHPIASLRTWAMDGYESILSRTINGRHLKKIGFKGDLTFCAQLNLFPIVPSCTFVQFHDHWLACIK